jgi:drug/metabolite transporter (DMT)-like permease
MRSAALLVILAALWGGSFVFMRVAVPALGPVVLAFVRVDVAAVALLALAYAQRRFPPFRTRWRDFAVVGVVNSALPFLLFSYAQQYVTASTGAILNATSPSNTSRHRPARSSTRRARSSARSPPRSGSASR